MSAPVISKHILTRIRSDVQKYRIERLIAVGGMAAVYAARHRNGNLVAIKFLLDKYADDVDVRRLFSRESYVANQVGHPGVVNVLDDDVDDEGYPFLVMPLLEGATFRQRWEDKNRRLSVVEVGVVIVDTLDVLSSAHAKGIIHRDIKPDNLFITTTGQVRVLDFGIARPHMSDATASGSGRILGTPAFMPPEQALGDQKNIGPHSDCWAVGATMFALLSGELVHSAESAGAQMVAAATKHARSLGGVMPELPSAIVDLVDKALAFAPVDRWQSALEMREALVEVFNELLGAPLSAVAAEIRKELARELLRKLGDEDELATLPPDRWHGVPKERDANLLEMREGVEEQSPLRTMRSEVAERIVSANHAPNRRRGRLVAAVLIALLAGVAILAIRRPKAGNAEPPAAMSPAGTSVVELPISPTCDKEAKLLYRAGLLAFQQGDSERAHSVFDRALVADPTCPELQVQAVVAMHALRPLPQVRERLQGALTVRNGLSERDRTLLDAITPIIMLEPDNRKGLAANLEMAASRFPFDAQVLVLAASAGMRSVPDPVTMDRCLAMARRATDIDVKYADAWQLQAHALFGLGRIEEAKEALSRCLEVAPGAVDCIFDRVYTHRQSGKCSEVVSDARRWISVAPTSAFAYAELANGLASEGASIEAVQAAIDVRRRNSSPGSGRELAYIYQQSALAALHGDFTSAREWADKLQHETRGSSLMFDQARAAALLVDLLIESGEHGKAAIVADRFFKTRAAWTEDFWGTADFEPFLLTTLLNQNKMSRQRWDMSMDAWEEHVGERMTKRQRWLLRWAPASTTRARALEAWTRRPDEPRDALLMSGELYYPSLMKMLEGRIALAIGENQQAVDWLEQGTNSCHNLQIPLSGTRAHLWLGQARENIGDPAGACRAYQIVLQRWGKAKPRSVTAEEANRHARALACNF